MKKEAYLAEISLRVTHILGLYFQANQYVDLERRLIAAAKELNIDYSISGLHEWLSQSHFSNLERHALSAHLTIGETYFFREKPALDLFVQQIIPNLIEQRRGKNQQIKIWSAGCSSGEEPYTLAILLKEHFPELNDWDVRILATDISPISIKKALLGEYTDWSFRETSAVVKHTYFTQAGANWRIDPELKKRITFTYLNLSENSYPSSITHTDEMDVIFCRNVLMYFTPEVIKEVSARFNASLCENGWLITSQVELNEDYFSMFERVHCCNGIFYQKTNKPAAKVKRPLTPPPQNDPVVRTKKKEINTSTVRIKKAAPAIKPPKKEQSEAEDPDELFQNGQYIRCIDSCLHLISQGKLTHTLFSILVKSYANSGLLWDGEKAIAKIMETNTATPEMCYIYASLLNEQNELAQTEVYLKKAIYLNHKHILSHLMLGNVFQKNGKKALAIKQYETTLGLLNECDETVIVPDSEGITTGRIKELVEQILNKL